MRGACTSILSRRSTRLSGAAATLLSFLACFLWASASWPATYTDKYDAEIERTAARWLPAYPSWKRGKAQLIQESGLRPSVCSAVGACGLGQFMPGTWQDAAKALKWTTEISRFDPEYGIEAWGWYQGRLYNTWKSNRPVEDRISLAEASYNAGLGWILKAQKLCDNAALWAGVMKCLPDVTGDHSKETISYTLRIREIWRRLELE